MEIVLAHSNTDFDSLAAQYAVTKLYPDTRMVPGYPLASNIRSYLSLYRDSLPLVDINYIDISKVTHIFIVDCQHIERLDEVARRLITENNVSYTIFDHHQPDPGNSFVSGAREDSIIRTAGASTTLLVEKLMERGEKLTELDATLLAIGIYEDSGCLTFGGTTAQDARAVAYLLEQGADLVQVSNFIYTKLDTEQTQLFKTFLANSKSYTISGARVTISQANCENFVEGLATLCRRLLEVSSSDAAFTVAYMRDRVYVVGRSDTPVVDVRAVVQEFGGGGHHGAASGVVKGRTVAEVVSEVLDILRANAKPEVLARDIMRSPVRTITASVSMEEAGRLMLRYDEDGLIVCDGDQLDGVVSKRDVDKAVHHQLGHAPAKGFMSRPVITASLTTPLSEIQKIMVHEDIGRLPVLDEHGKLAGIVTRREVLNTLYGGVQRNGVDLNLVIEKRRVHLNEKLAALEAPTRWLFEEIGNVASRLGMVAYAVGGCVRDLFLDRANFDLDFVVEGSAIQLAAALERAYPGRFQVVRKHDRFQTATIKFHADVVREIDLSTARTEFYEHPAALPTVEASVLEQDLFRRDFTINALAVCINPDEYGDVIDFFDGIGDIEDCLIRILHKFSFIEDPTRIIRAARFASRLGFHLERATRRQAQRAIAMGVFDNLGGFRLKEELKPILESPQRLQALELLNELGGGLRYLASNLVYDESVRSAMRRAERLLARNPLKDSWVVYLGTLLAKLDKEALEAAMDRLDLANDEREWIRSGLHLLRQLDASEIGGTPTRSEIYARLHGHSDPALAIAASLAAPGSRTRRWIKLYLDELRSVKVFLSGDDLMRIGFPQGPTIGEALERVREAKLDGEVTTPAQELEFIRKNYPQYR